MNNNRDTIATALLQEHTLVSETLNLQIGHCRLDLRSNSSELISKLQHYFASCEVLGDHGTAHINIIAIESESPELNIDFIDWKREPGKSGRKDEYCDLDGVGLESARVVRKVRTGMVFLQSQETVMAAGPCIQYDNQVINFINSQYMNWLQQQDWLICHASGLVLEDKGLAIAGFSGGGKSTLMLNFMNDPKVTYMTNDRLFIGQSEGKIEMSGIPKLPRINPGTIIGNPVLHPLMSQEDLATYQAMEQEKLWDIEEKYDVSIQDIYGEQRIQNNAFLNTFVILNWQRGSEEPVALTQVDISQRRDLLKAIMKSSGPFYQDKAGVFETDTFDFDEEAYLSLLADVNVYEAHGQIDFQQLTKLCLDVLA